MTDQIQIGDLTDDELATIIDTPELLVGTTITEFSDKREITDTVSVEMSTWTPAKMMGVESTAGVVVEDGSLGVNFLTNGDGHVKVIELLKKIDDGDVDVVEWSDDVAKLAE